MGAEDSMAPGNGGVTREQKRGAMRAIAERLYEDNGFRCNCDLDNWLPEGDTGHSWVCGIHKAAIKIWHEQERARCGRPT